MAVDPFAGANQGLKGLQDTLMNIYQMKRQDKLDAQTSALQGLQTQAAQQGIDKGKLELAGLNAERNALIGRYGTEKHTDPYASAIGFQSQEKYDSEQNKLKQEQKLAKAKMFMEGYTKFNDGVENDKIDPDDANKAFKAVLKMADIDMGAAGVDVTFKKGRGGYYSGPITPEALVMMNGQPVPYGAAGTVSKARIASFGPDGKPVFEFDEHTTYEPTKAADETWGEPYSGNVGGKKVMLQKSSRGQVRAVAQDASTTVKVNTGTPQTDFKNESAMRKEFLTLPEVKDFPTIESNSKRAVAALKAQGKSNVAVDQAIITVFNKMLDPASVVRESEYARTPQDLSLLSRIKGKWDKVQRGGAGLDSAEREALARMVTTFNEIASQQYNDQVDYYSGLAKRYGYKPENIVRLGGRKAEASTTSTAPKGKPAAPRKIGKYTVEEH